MFRSCYNGFHCPLMSNVKERGYSSGFIFVIHQIQYPKIRPLLIKLLVVYNLWFILPPHCCVIVQDVARAGELGRDPGGQQDRPREEPRGQAGRRQAGRRPLQHQVHRDLARWAAH